MKIKYVLIAITLLCFSCNSSDTRTPLEKCVQGGGTWDFESKRCLHGFNTFHKSKPNRESVGQRSLLLGNWIGAYTQLDNGNDSSQSGLNTLLKFTENTMLSRGLSFENADSVLSAPYSFDQSVFTIGSETVPIYKLSADSLVIGDIKNDQREFVFKKLDANSPTTSYDFAGDAYAILGPVLSDSIEFLNDTMALHISTDAYRGFSPLRLTTTACQNLKGNPFQVNYSVSGFGLIAILSAHLLLRLPMELIQGTLSRLQQILFP